MPSDRTRGSEHKVKHRRLHHILCCEGDGVLMQVAQRHSRVSDLGDAQKLSYHGPGLLALGSPVQAGELDQVISRGHFLPQTLHDSVN